MNSRSHPVVKYPSDSTRLIRLRSDAGLPVDCGVLVLVDFAYLFLVFGQAAFAQVESVWHHIYQSISSSFIKESIERNPLALAHIPVAHWADCFRAKKQRQELLLELESILII